MRPLPRLCETSAIGTASRRDELRAFSVVLGVLRGKMLAVVKRIQRTRFPRTMAPHFPTVVRSRLAYSPPNGMCAYCRA